MEVPASSSALAADSIDAQIAANKIAHDIVVAKNAANKRSKTSEATPIAAETSLPDAISSSFYMPGQRLSLADIDTLLAYNDAAVTSVLKLRNDNDAPIRHPKSGQVMEAASDEWPHWDERQRRLACLISCCPELVELPATTIARPAPATDVNVQLQDVAQSFTTVQGDIKVLTEASAAATAQLLELKKAMAAPAKTTTFADVTGKQLTTIVQQAAKSAATAAVTQNAVQQRQRNMVIKGFQTGAAAHETAHSLAEELRGPAFLGKMQLQNRVVIERAIRLPGPPGLVVVTMASMHDKRLVLGARRLLQPGDFSLDEDYTPAQLKARSAVWNSTIVQETKQFETPGKRIN
eukprot:jgi/Mesvir1/10975/Mv13719-RA.1